MEPNTVVAVLSLLVSSVALGLLVFLLRRGPQDSEQAQRLSQLEQTFTQQLSAHFADSAARLERVRGDLRQELTDRITADGQTLQTLIGQQLQVGRTEQEQRLRDTVARLEAKFDGLAGQQAQILTHTRQELVSAVGQSRTELTAGLAQARQELSAGLVATTRALEEKLVSVEGRTGAALDAIRSRVEERLGEIGRHVQEKLDQNIKEGFAQFEKVQQHLRAAEEQLRSVGQIGVQVGELSSLLRMPHLRGRFGEQSLERLLADFLPAHMYEVQQTLGDSRARPDVIIRLNDRVLPIDSKFPREQIAPLFESADPGALAAARVELERVIKEQGRRIAGYIDVEAGTTNVALLYLPSETLWFEVVQNRTLAEHLANCGVFPCSPNTLMLTLHAISLTYKWYRVAEGFAQTARELALAQKHFGHFEKQFEQVGRSIQKAQEAYATATSHLARYQTRVAAMTGDVPLNEQRPEEFLPLQMPAAS